jgi:hypothetical protein
MQNDDDETTVTFLKLSNVKKSEPVNPLTFSVIEWVVDYLQLALETSHVLLFALFNLLFTAGVTLLLLFMEHFFPEVRDDPKYLGIMDPVNILIGFVFMSFMQQNLTGYADAIRHYRQYLNTVEKLGLFLSPTMNTRIRDLLVYLVAKGDGIHRPTSLNSRLPPELVIQPNMSCVQLKLNQLKTKPDDVACAKIAAQELVLEVHKSNLAATHDEAVRLLSSIIDKLQDHESRTAIRPPDQINAQNRMLLVLWFGIWLPVRLWIALGFWIPIILYPFFSYFLWGTFIQRIWLDTPWNLSRPFNESEHQYWPMIYKQNIETSFRSANLSKQTSYS